MSDNVLSNGQIKAPDEKEHSLGASLAGGHTIIIKALASNEGTIWLGATGTSAKDKGYPLAKGESVTLPLKNAKNIFYTAEKTNDQLAYLVTGA